MAKDDADSWKKKYYASLERLESQEARLTDLDDLLRTGIARLSLAAEGHNPAIDRELKRLRKLARDRQDAAELRAGLDKLAEAVRRHEAPADATKPHTAGLDAHELLAATLRDLQVPPTLEPELSALRARLKDTSDAGLFREVPAFLAKLARLTLTAAEPIAPTPTVLVSGATAGVPAPAWLALDSLIDELHLPPADKAVLTQRRVAEAAGRVEQQWQALLHELSQLINRRLDATTPDAAGVGSPATNTVLLELLQYIPLPAELAGELETIRDRLSREIPVSEWPQILNAIAELIAEMRRRVEAEKTDLESFLLQLTNRLKEIDASLQGADSERRSSYQSGRALDRAVQEQVSGIESSMQQNLTLDQLKSAIHGRIETIRQRMDNHRLEDERHNAEMERRLRDMGARLQGFERETTELRSTLKLRREQALLDALTGVPNRLAWDERLAQEVSRWQRYHTPLALLVLDVDHFKHINDHYGHKAGDKALQLIARVLRQSLRDSDFLARYGGEEFVALISDNSVTQVAAVAEKLRHAIAAAVFHFRGQPVPITLSCGYAVFRDGDNADSVFHRADGAVYRAKAEGRNCAVNGNTLPAA